MAIIIAVNVVTVVTVVIVANVVIVILPLSSSSSLKVNKISDKMKNSLPGIFAALKLSLKS